MKILVAIKQVIDAEVRVPLKPAGQGIDASGLKMAMNPYDETAVEAAVRLIEQGVATDATIVSIGPAAAGDTIRTALAMGGSAGILVKTETAPEPQAVAKILKALCDDKQPDLVLCGKQAIDDEGGQVAARLAGLLDWPQALNVSALRHETDALLATCETERGRTFVRLPLPAVLSCDLRLNTPRFASLPRLIQAKKKPIAETTPHSLGVDTTPRLKTLCVAEPPPRPPITMVESVDDLLAVLRVKGVLA